MKISNPYFLRCNFLFIYIDDKFIPYSFHTIHRISLLIRARICIVLCSFYGNRLFFCNPLLFIWPRIIHKYGCYWPFKHKFATSLSFDKSIWILNTTNLIRRTARQKIDIQHPSRNFIKLIQHNDPIYSQDTFL